MTPRRVIFIFFLSSMHTDQYISIAADMHTCEQHGRHNGQGACMMFGCIHADQQAYLRHTMSQEGTYQRIAPAKFLKVRTPPA